MSICYEGIIKIEEMEPQEEYRDSVVNVTGPARAPFKRVMKGLMQEARDQRRSNRALRQKVKILKAERDQLIEMMELVGLSVKITRERT